jgi:hypothetical protein
MKTNRDITYPIAKQITAIAVDRFEIKGEPRQFTVQIDPLISNMMFHRELEIIAHERLTTIMKLSRILDDNMLFTVADALDLEVNIKKDK